MCDQISRKQRDEEIAWAKRQREEASNNVAAPISDYRTASWFDLNARKDWDAESRMEIERRQNS